MDGLDLSTTNEIAQRIQNIPITKGEIIELIKKYDSKSLCTISKI